MARVSSRGRGSRGGALSLVRCSRNTVLVTSVVAPAYGAVCQQHVTRMVEPAIWNVATARVEVAAHLPARLSFPRKFPGLFGGLLLALLVLASALAVKTFSVTFLTSSWSRVKIFQCSFLLVAFPRPLLR